MQHLQNKLAEAKEALSSKQLQLEQVSLTSQQAMRVAGTMRGSSEVGLTSCPQLCGGMLTVADLPVSTSNCYRYVSSKLWV